MKLSFLVQRDVLNAVVITAVSMPTMAVGSVVTGDGDLNPAGEDIPRFTMSNDEMMYWITHTDAKLTFVGDSINPLSSLPAQIITITYCSSVTNNVCGGPCTVYSGGRACLYTPDTNCLAATHNIRFCDGPACDGNCNHLSTCNQWLAGGFCYAPGTNSIAVGNTGVP